MNNQLESRIRAHLSSLDDVGVADPAIVAASVGRAVRRARNRRRIGVGVVSLGLVSIATVAVWTTRTRDTRVASSVIDTAGSSGSQPPVTIRTTTTSSSPATDPETGAWSMIAADPRGVTSLPSVVWTGTEAIVVGGLDQDGRPRSDAAAYDPADDTWRTLAGPQWGADLVDRVVVWTGTEVLAIGGEPVGGGQLKSGASAYNPERDEWRVMAAPSLSFVTSRSPFAWTGSELLVWPWQNGDPSIVPLAYDPVADVWRQLPLPPVVPRQQSGSSWSGTEWIIWGGTTGVAELADGAAYDPATNSWRVIAESPLSARRVRTVWTGSEMVVAAGSSGGDRETGNGEMALADGAAYDPATDTWRAIASGLAHPGFVPLWTGSHVVMFAKGGAVVYDVAADRWIDTCCSESGGGGGGAAPVWTGSTVLLIGSYDTRSGGSVFDPP